MFMICTSYSLYLRRGLLCCRATRLAKPVIPPLNASGTLYMINPTAMAAVFRARLHINYCKCCNDRLETTTRDDSRLSERYIFVLLFYLQI